MTYFALILCIFAIRCQLFSTQLAFAVQAHAPFAWEHDALPVMSQKSMIFFVCHAVVRIFYFLPANTAGPEYVLQSVFGFGLQCFRSLPSSFYVFGRQTTMPELHHELRTRKRALSEKCGSEGLHHEQCLGSAGP